MRKQNSGARRKRAAHAERYQTKASDLFAWSDSGSPGERQELQAALVSAKRSLLLDADNYETLVLIGHILSAFGERATASEAADYYDRAITLRPQAADAYCGKANLMMDQLDSPEEAERLARKGLQLSIRSREGRELRELRYISLLGILEGRKKYPQARWLIREAVKNCPSELMKGLAECTLKRIAAD